MYHRTHNERKQYALAWAKERAPDRAHKWHDRPSHVDALTATDDAAGAGRMSQAACCFLLLARGRVGAVIRGAALTASTCKPRQECRTRRQRQTSRVCRHQLVPRARRASIGGGHTARCASCTGGERSVAII